MKFSAKFKEDIIDRRIRFITKRERERIKNRLNEIAPEIIEDMNKNLERGKKPGASPPQYMRRNPEWIHYPIEKAWEYEIEDRGLNIRLYIRNYSQHFLAVEYGVNKRIETTHADYLVWDTASGEVRKREWVRGQENKGFVAQTVAEWKDKIPSLLKK